MGFNSIFKVLTYHKSNVQQLYEHPQNKYFIEKRQMCEYNDNNNSNLNSLLRSLTNAESPQENRVDDKQNGSRTLK
jgi:hypothetical protein